MASERRDSEAQEPLNPDVEAACTVVEQAKSTSEYSLSCIWAEIVRPSLFSAALSRCTLQHTESQLYAGLILELYRACCYRQYSSLCWSGSPDQIPQIAAPLAGQVKATQQAMTPAAITAQ